MKHCCKYCDTECIKKGIRNSVQKYLCKNCNRYQQKEYRYKSCTQHVKQCIAHLTKEGSGISSISRHLKVSKSTVQRELLEIGNGVNKPVFNESCAEYELDEMTVTIAGKKDIYLIYAINRQTRQVIDFFIGNRTKENIRKVVDTVLSYSPVKIFTDRLNIYPSLIPRAIHFPGRRLTNRIERKNLSLRTWVKRLSRYTLCFTKSVLMLEICVRICLWYD